MILRRLVLRNFGPFRGEHVLDDLDRLPALGIFGPNGSGKSALLDAVGFALYGRVRSSSVARWKTRGTSEMSVALTLRGEDGGDLLITRGWRDTRNGEGRGHVELKGWEGSSAKHVRRDAVERKVGLDWEDFLSTRFLAQADVQRLGAAKPAERREIVERWVARAVWPRAISHADQKRLQLQRAFDRAAGDVSAARRAHAAAVARGEAWAKADSDVAACERSVAEAQRNLEAHGEAPQPGAELLDLRVQMARANDEMADAERNSAAFDGQCPVLREPCPVADQVRGRTDALARAYRRALAKSLSVGQRLVAAEDAHNLAARTWRVRRGYLEDDLKLQEGHLRRAREHGAVGAEVERAVSQARESWTTAEAERDALAAELAEWTSAARALASISAAEVEEAVDEAEAGAGAVLRGIGVPLGVRFSHARDTGKWAAACASCGAEGKHRAGKCPRCGASWPRARRAELDLVIETPAGDDDFADGSGGRRDLVSLALRLAFSRGVGRLRFVFADEVLRQLDAQNRRALAQYLFGGGAGALGIDQVWVVAHDAAAMAAAPRLLEVVPGAEGSTLRWAR